MSTGRPPTRLLAGMRDYPGQFWLLTAGIFIYLVGVFMCFPFQTLYLSDRLGISMTTVGLILGVAAFVGLPAQLLGGAVADRFGRKWVLAFAISACMTLYIGLGLTSQLWLVILLIAYEAAFGWAMFITSSNAIIADMVPPERRAEAYSLTRTSMNAGMIVGPLIAAVLIGADPTFRTPFVAAGAVSGVFLVMVVVRLRETKPLAADPAEGGRSTFAGYAVVLRDRRFLAFCALALLPLYGLGQIWAILPVHLRDHLGVAPETWGVLLAVYGVGATVFQYPLVRRLRGHDNMLLMAVASALLGIGLGGAALLPWGWQTVACVVVVSLGVVLLIPISSTIVSAMAPVELRGRYMGAWTIVYLAGYGLGPLLGGAALDVLGGHGAFIVVMGAGLLGAARLPLLREHRRRPAVPAPAAPAFASDEDAQEPATVGPPPSL